MQLPRSLFSLAVFICLLNCCPARAAEGLGNIVAKGKSATALVEVKKGDLKGYGSAVCVDATGLFVTCEHVVRAATGEVRVALILQPGEKNERAVTATIIRSDKERDLALLRVSEPGTYPVLAIGDSSGLSETVAVTAFGYPFGTELSAKGEYPAISVTTNHVTSLRKVKGQLETIQVDGALNPGHSGGPLLDDRGRVVGLVRSGIMGTGLSFAVPTEAIRSFLEAPFVSFDPPVLKFGEQFRPLEFRVQVKNVVKPARVPTVQLTLKSEGYPARVFDLKATGDEYKVSAPPLTPPAAVEKLSIIASFGEASMTGELAAFKFKAGDRELRLDQVSSIQTGSKPLTVLTDGTGIAGPISGFDQVEMTFGSAKVNVPLSKANHIIVRNPQVLPIAVEYTVTVLDGERVLSSQTGNIGIPLVDVPPAGDRPGGGIRVKAPAFEGDTLEVQLPGPADDVTVGGGGRYVLLTIKKLSKIAIFDVSTAKIAGYIPLQGAGVLVTAGADRAIVVIPESKVIQSWDLASQKRILSAPLKGTITCVSMGSASMGPILVRAASENEDLNRATFSFLDAMTLKPLEDVTMAQNNFLFNRDIVHARASADGSVFGLWNTAVAPSGVCTIIRANGTKPKTFYQHDSTTYVLPSGDGSMLFCGPALFTPQCKKLVETTMNDPDLLPAMSGGFYFSMPKSVRDLPNREPRLVKAGSVFSVGSRSPLVTLPEMPELNDMVGDPWVKHDFTSERRCMFYESIGLFVSVPASNDRIVLRKFDLLAALEKSAANYLFVATTPTPTVEKGKPYVYGIEAKTKKGPVTYTLENGPVGMTLSAQGLISWSVPANYPEKEAVVIVNIKAQGGQSIYHTFNIAVTEAAQ